jgi:hypothetical protein
MYGGGESLAIEVFESLRDVLSVDGTEPIFFVSLEPLWRKERILSRMPNAMVADA